MKSEKGMGRVRFVILLIVLLLLLGPTVYVIIQENGVYEREVQPLIENAVQDSNTTEELNAVVEK